MTDIRILKTRNGVFRIALDGIADAPVLVLSNSLGTTLELWDRQAQTLSRTYRVLRYDTRGHGQSVVTPGPYSFSQLGGDVLAILDALRIERARFCGLSMGGHIGLWLAIHAAARFVGIAVCNSAAKIGTEQGWQERAGLIQKGGVAAMRKLADSAPDRWFTPAFINAEPQVVHIAQQWLAHIDPEGYAANCEALGASDLRPKLGQIRVPLLLLAGEFDPVTTVDDAKAMQHAIVGAKLATVAASHLSNLEAPQAFEAALTCFLDGLPAEALRTAHSDFQH
ncbi:3-oxoadipate enol-lactonase [Castellaniella sp.]|uniref:3-oxoadipate enol-lactonase n=1 Tax=Castellaniella sp. TaxID=1955812 RepID=UPI003D13F4B5